MNSKLSYKVVLLALAATVTSQTVLAQGFRAGVSPSKFEFKTKPGVVIRDTLTIMNAGDEPAEYLLRTADWTVNDSQGADFIEDRLLDDSCRPWVRLERKSVRIRPTGQKKYRFEIHVPEDAAPGLCKFALLIEPGEPVMASTQGDQPIKFPVVGRYATVVYVTIGDATADIDFLGLGAKEVQGYRLPTLKLHNNGNTYDRVFGEITATDADGKRHLLTASSFPVLPDRSEEIMLLPEPGPGPEPNKIELSYPLSLKGKFEIGGKKFTIEENFN